MSVSTRSLSLPAGGGEPACVVDDAAGAHRVHDRCQLGSGQVPHPPELLCSHTFRERVQYVRLRAADTHGHERGDVPVAAVLAQQVGPVPEPRQRLRGHWQRPHRCVEGPSIHRGAGPRLDHELSSTGDAGALGEVAQNSAQRRNRTPLARCVGGLRSDPVPDTRDVAGHLTVGEVVEDRVDDLGRYIATQRGGPSREVGVPHVAGAERHHCFGRFVSHVGDDRDGLDELKESAGHGVRHGRVLATSRGGSSGGCSSMRWQHCQERRHDHHNESATSSPRALKSPPAARGAQISSVN